MTPSLDAEQEPPLSAGMTRSSSFALLYQGLHETLVESVKEAQALVEESGHQPRSIATLLQLLHQIGGALQLVELTGAIELVGEIKALVSEAGVERLDSQRATLLLDALATLLRYLNFLQAGRRPLPALLLSAINRLRIAGRRPPLPDSHFDLAHFRPSHPLPGLDLAKIQPIDSQKRLRQLYQVGLTNLLREQNVEPSLGWMAHALDRLSPGPTNPWRATLWRLGSTLLRHFAIEQRVVPDDGKKRLFSALDRQIRLQIEQPDETAFIEPLRTLITEFVHLLRLNRNGDDAIEQWLALIAAPELDHCERDLLVGRLYLHGEDQRTLKAVVGALFDELQNLRRYLEGVAIAAPFQREVVLGFIDQLDELSGALRVSHLRALAEEGLQLQQTLRQWLESTETLPTEAQLGSIAERVVAFEQRLIEFRHGDTGADQPLPLLREARQTLAQESRANLAICKQAIENYLSSRESLHLANLAEVLDSVRGAALFLERSELIELIERVLHFIALLPTHDGPNVPAEVEALADILVILEFLLGTPVDQPLDAALLQLARVTAATLP